MMYANDFFEILDALRENTPLKERVLALIDEESIHGKSTRGGDRVEQLKNVLARLVKGEIGSLDEAYKDVELQLPREVSSHSADNRTFADGWGERLIRIQLSRFYNQAVMELLREDGKTQVFVPHSTHEEAKSTCSRELAGKSHDLQGLYDLLVKSYRDEDYTDRSPKIPNHPHCTHVVRPAE